MKFNIIYGSYFVLLVVVVGFSSFFFVGLWLAIICFFSVVFLLWISPITYSKFFLSFFWSMFHFFFVLYYYLFFNFVNSSCEGEQIFVVKWLLLENRLIFIWINKTENVQIRIQNTDTRIMSKCILSKSPKLLTIWPRLDVIYQIIGAW